MKTWLDLTPGQRKILQDTIKACNTAYEAYRMRPTVALRSAVERWRTLVQQHRFNMGLDSPAHNLEDIAPSIPRRC